MNQPAIEAARRAYGAAMRVKNLEGAMRAALDAAYPKLLAENQQLHEALEDINTALQEAMTRCTTARHLGERK